MGDQSPDEDQPDLEIEALLRGAPARVREMIENLPDNDPPRAAYHESGHSVAALHLHLPLTEVSIWPNEDEQWVGETTIDWVSDSQRVNIERETGDVLVFVFAGLFSQLQWDPHPDLQAWSSDERDVAELLTKLDESPADNKKRVEVAKLRAASSVEAWWPEIKYVAEVLIDRHKLSTAELRRLVGAA